MLLAANDGDSDEATSKLQSRGNGLLEARGDALLDQQPIDDDFDGMILAFVQARRGVQWEKFAIDADADVAILGQLFELLAVRSFSPANDRSQDHDAIVRLAQLAVENSLDYLFAGLSRDGIAAFRAMRDADRRVDDPEVVVNFGDGADRRTRRARRRFLLDGDRRGKAFDDVDLGALHLIEELPRVSGERFYVTPLALRINGVEGQRGFSGAGKTGNHGE